MNENYTVIHAHWDTHRNLLLSVRYAVFVEEQGIPASIEVDDADASAIHRLALNQDGSPIGTARLSPNGQIGRVAVLQDYRRSGIGSKLMTALIQDAQTHGYRQVTLHAQLRSVEFYEQLGFRPQGEVFEEVGIPHREMVHDL